MNAAIPTYEEQIEGIEVEESGVYAYLDSVRRETVMSFMGKKGGGGKEIERDKEIMTEGEGEEEEQEKDEEGEEGEEGDADYSGIVFDDASAPEDALVPEHTNGSKWQHQILSQFLSIKNETESLPPSHTQWSPPNTSSQWRKLITETPPRITIIRQFDHVTCMRLMSNLTSWLTPQINENMSQWIYSMFLRVDNVLQYDDCAVIRGIGLKAVKILSSAHSFTDTGRYTSYFIITIVNGYYGQRDIKIPETVQTCASDQK